MTQQSDKRVCLGVITSAHGIRGEVKIKPFTESSNGLTAYGPLQDKSGARRFEITASRVAGNVLVARLQGIDDRNAAEALRGVELYIDRDTLPDPEDETWYFTDLIGLAVFDQENTRLGEVSAIHNFGAGDMLEIISAETGESGFLPFTIASVPDIDVTEGRITIVTPDDLFTTAEKNPAS